MHLLARKSIRTHSTMRNLFDTWNCYSLVKKKRNYTRIHLDSFWSLYFDSRFFRRYFNTTSASGRVFFKKSRKNIQTFVKTVNNFLYNVRTLKHFAPCCTIFYFLSLFYWTLRSNDKNFKNHNISLNFRRVRSMTLTMAHESFRALVKEDVPCIKHSNIKCLQLSISIVNINYNCRTLIIISKNLC